MIPSVMAELGQRPIAEIAAALGMRAGPRGSWGPCPACQAEARSAHERRPRRPLGTTPSGRGWYCVRCGVRGDGGTLAALALVGDRRPDAEGMLVVEAWASSHGLCLPRGDGRAVAYVPPPPPAPPPPPNYPPLELLDDVRRAWPGDLEARAAVAAWMRGRGLVASPHAWAQARIVARTARALVPAGYPLVVPLCDATGTTRSVHCRRADEQTPKTRSPTGYDVRGLFFADSVALAMLRGTAPAAGLAVVVEGVTDYLRACSIAPPDVAVLGGINGSFLAIGALACLPESVWVLTDPDEPGDRYAADVAAGCPHAVRVRPPEGQDLDSAGWTWDDVERVALRPDAEPDEVA